METLKDYLFKAQLLTEMFDTKEYSLKKDIDYSTKRLEHVMKEDGDNEYSKEIYTKEIKDARHKLEILKKIEQDIVNNLIR